MINLTPLRKPYYVVGVHAHTRIPLLTDDINYTQCRKFSQYIEENSNKYCYSHPIHVYIFDLLVDDMKPLKSYELLNGKIIKTL